MKFSNRNFAQSNATAVQYDAGLRQFMLQIYNYMAVALALTGFFAVFASHSDVMMSMLYHVENGRIKGMAALGWIVAFAPLFIIFALGATINTMSLQKAKLLFWVYAGVMGLSLSSLFLLYTGASIARVFFITASVFAGMSLYGYSTKKDLTKFGSFLIMGLFGIILASLVNMFMRSTGLHFAVSILTVLIFTGLTAYDTQRLKAMYYQVGVGGDASGKAAIMGALSLYMNFINLFVHLLQFLGDKRSQ